MSQYVITPEDRPSLAVRGSQLRFPVRRIYCVGRNFADHAKEMGVEVDRETPVFFMKPADAIVVGGGEIPYPSFTSDLHHEVELVVALGAAAEGRVSIETAMSLVYGYAVGLDLTRRDLQAAAKAKGMPWDVSKGFDRSAPISDLLPVSEATPSPEDVLWLDVNGVRRQASALSNMIFSVPEIIHELSKRFELRAGDLIFMGTPAGVSALNPGDQWQAGVGDWVQLEGGITLA